MRIGVPREIKVHEYRVGLVPAGVRELTAAGHEVIVETAAGGGIGVTDAQYEACGAKVVASAAQVFAGAEMVGAKSGIGYMIWSAWETFAVTKMYVGLFVIALIGFAISLLLNEIGRTSR